MLKNAILDAKICENFVKNWRNFDKILLKFTSHRSRCPRYAALAHPAHVKFFDPATSTLTSQTSLASNACQTSLIRVFCDLECFVFEVMYDFLFKIAGSALFQKKKCSLSEASVCLPRTSAYSQMEHEKGSDVGC